VRRYTSIGLLTFLLSTALAAQTLPPAATEEEAEITVVGMSEPKKASFEQFREAQQTFRKWQPKLAPNAKLEFEIVSHGILASTEADLSSIRMALVSDEKRIEIPIDAVHRFVMPDLIELSPMWARGLLLFRRVSTRQKLHCKRVGLVISGWNVRPAGHFPSLK
jgi:hypothetical protein